MSNTATLTAVAGRATGSANSRRLRSEDRIPGVLYGHGMSPVSLSVARRDLRIALSGPAGANTVLALSVDGNTFNAVVKEMQRHPVKRTVSHVDFIQVNLNEEITVHVPVHLTGTAKAVVSAGGLVDPAVDTIEVRTTPTNIPNEVLIDISDMQTDSVIRLSDIKLPSGVVATGDADMPVVTVLMSRAAIENAAAATEAPAAPAAE
ncbi:MAG: 50S ribosomal protein L25 [Actinobacteria bacterium]|nr:50S ribosomal protein L25 [Actinomycetota bacterium]